MKIKIHKFYYKKIFYNISYLLLLQRSSKLYNLINLITLSEKINLINLNEKIIKKKIFRVFVCFIHFYRSF